MAAVSGNAAGFIATLAYKTAVDTTKSEATLSAISAGTGTDEFIVAGVSSMGALEKTRNIIDIPVYGEDVASKLPGQADPGTFDFTVTLDLSNSVHTGIRDDDGKTPHTYVVTFTQGTNSITYGGFDGYVANATVNQPIDGAITMDVSIARDGAITWVDDSN